MMNHSIPQWQAAEIRSYCPVCDARNIRWQPLPHQYFIMARNTGYKHFGSGEMTSLFTYSCPICGASDRERLYALFLRGMKAAQEVALPRMIHFAPEAALSKHIRQEGYFDSYKTADFAMQGVDFKVDLQAQPFDDDHFDFFICSHVLGHVPDDRLAMRELYRVTRPGGFGLLMAPICLGIQQTLEDPSITDATERWRLFGQDDHLRLYSHDDYVKRIEESGFLLQQLTLDDFGADVFHQLGLKSTSILYVVSKPLASSPEKLSPPHRIAPDWSSLIPSAAHKPTTEHGLDTPKVSVILTSFNHEKFLHEAIQSALSQTYRNFELIIWDDASTDDSWSIIQQYKDKRIKAFRSEVRRRGGVHINKSISEIARGEYIAIHHSDDVWELEKLEKQVAFLDRHPETGAVFTWVNIIDVEGNTIHDSPMSKTFRQENKTRHEWLRHFFLHANALCHPSVLIRRQCYTDCGLYNLGFWQLTDFEMWVRLCFKYEIHVLPEHLVRFRWSVSGSNTSATTQENIFRDTVEKYIILGNCLQIASLADLVKIFPAAKKYCVSPEADLEFALAMAIIESTSTAYQRLFGLKLLHKLLASPERAKKIRTVHHFDHIEFADMVGQWQIFATPKLRMPHESFFPLERGISAFDRKDYTTAIECLSVALEHEPENPLPSAYLAFICAQQGLPQGARDFIAQAIKLAPDRADLIAGLGEIFLKNNCPLEAVEYLLEAIHIQPDLFAAYPAFAQSLHLTGQSEEAISLLQSVVSLSSDAQANIQNVLLQILAECGDLSEFTQFTRSFSCNLTVDLLAAHCLSRFEESGEPLLETLAQIQTRLAENAKGYSCHFILSRFDFGWDGIYHCCIGIDAAERPLVVQFNGGEFPFDDYLKSAHQYIQNNLRLEGPCKGCKFLAYQPYATQFKGFNYISINNWTRCHLNCYYCDLDKAAWRKNKIVPYNPLPALESLTRRGWIQKGALIDFGGGEPSIYEYLDDVVDFVIRHNLTCHINTNAVIFSQTIHDALCRKGQFQVTVSPDAGTAESYQRVKDQDLFHAVTENIVRYAQTGGAIALKYNVTPYANRQEDIAGFIDLLKKSGIRLVRISPELHAYYSASNREYREVLHFAKALYGEISRMGVSVELPWKSQDSDFIRAKLATLPESTDEQKPLAHQSGELTRIAFMVGDFTPDYRIDQLCALVRYLPPERFFTILICCHTHEPANDQIEMCLLLADTVLLIHQDADALAVEKIRALAPDILVNMQPYTHTDQLAVFLDMPARHKFLWGEAPLPPITPDVRVLAGARLSVEAMLPTVTLPELGEVFDLPELPFTDKAARKMGEAPVLGCLVPASGIANNGWQLFAETLRQFPNATLVLNLEKLTQPAQQFIRRQFSSAGIDPARLVFIHVSTPEEFCQAWQSIDLGLLPPINPAGLALPTCLWMGKPCLVPASILPWALRPAAFLRALDRETWIATDAAHYASLALQLAPPGVTVTPDPTLRERMRALGLADAKGFAQHFADAMLGLPAAPPPPEPEPGRPVEIFQADAAAAPANPSLSGGAKIPCYVVMFFDYESAMKSLDFLVQYSARLDITVIENHSDYTERHFKPYLADLLKQGKISRYFLFDENIGMNAVETVLTQDREKLAEHEYLMITDGDLTVQDPGWLDEQIGILANPEVAVSGLRLDTSNLPLDKYPDAPRWVLPSREAAGKNYMEGETGWWLALYKTKIFFRVLEFLKLMKGQLSDVNSFHILEKYLGLKWVRTKNAQAYHLTWDVYADLDHPYTKWKMARTYHEIWHHARYSGYTLYDQDHETRGEGLRPEATTAPANTPAPVGAKIPCYVLAFFDHESVVKCLDFLVQYSARLDITVIENFSPYTESHIKPYLADLLKQGKISRYFLFEENIGANAMETILTQDREKLLTHEYFMCTDGDLTVQDPGWLDEQIGILANPEVAASGVRLDSSNLPPDDKFPGANTWIQPAREIAGKNYLDSPTGWHLTLFKPGLFFAALNHILKSEKGNLIDFDVRKIFEALGFKWVSTKKARAYHLTWDVYSNPDHPYTKWKLSKTPEELFRHKRYCGYTLYDQAHETRGEERLRPKATTAPQNAPLSGDAKIPCYVIAFFDHETVMKSLDFLVQYSARLDITVIENFSPYTESHIKPYLADLLKQGKISRYFLFEENIGVNAMETILKHDREKLLEHEYFMSTDGDLTVQDPGWLDEQIGILANPEVAASGVRLDSSNLPPDDKFPGANTWIPPAREIAGKNYLDSPTGWHLTLFKPGLFFAALDFILQSEKGNLVDIDVRKVLEAQGFKWVSTKKARAYHLTWDAYNNPDHPYTKWKLSKTPQELWRHNRYCNYTLFDKDKLP